MPPALTIADPDHLPAALRGASTAIGNFDGLHRGHQVILGRALAMAKAAGAPTTVLTFEPHPRTLFRPHEPVFRLTPPSARARILSALGFDGMVVMPFGPETAQLSPGEFVAHFLRRRLEVSAVAVGADFHFGRNREGSAAFLAEAGRAAGFAVDVTQKVADEGGAPFSSRRAREALVAGDVATANGMFGYRWFVIGEVVHGDARGRELGYPTANLDLGPDFRLRHGIYAVKVARASGETFAGVANFGRRPTFGGGAPLLEAHLFDFAGDLYGETITVSFIDWIRPEEKFDSAAALVARMAEDAAAARIIVAAAGEGGPLDRLLAAKR